MKKQIHAIVIALGVMYLLGIATSLYVPFEESASREDQFHTAMTHFLSAAHIIVGVGLLLNAIGLLVQARKTTEPGLKPALWVGFVAILLAAWSGSEFVGQQNDAYSLSMAFFFIVALFAYGWALLPRQK